MTSITSGNSLAVSTQLALNATANQPTAQLRQDLEAILAKRGPEDVTVVFGPNGQQWTVKA
jgi:poly-gamma-glutamate capsule biosynthesis protein CapA/YwtB (metallophosphatase superfamily)